MWAHIGKSRDVIYCILKQQDGLDFITELRNGFGIFLRELEIDFEKREKLDRKLTELYQTYKDLFLN